MIRKPLFASVALALLAATAVSAPASAAHHKMKMAKKVKLVPAALKPTYRGMPGYVGGGPAVAGAPPLMLIDVPLVAPGSGLLNAGLLPSTGVFKGVPVLGDLGF